MDEKVALTVTAFFTQYKHQLYKKGEIIIRADDDPQGLYFLELGRVKQYLITKKGDEVILNIFSEKAFFPMSWALNNSKNNYYYEAMTDVSLYRAPREATLQFLNENPEVVFDLLRRVFRGIDGLLLHMAYVMSGSAYARLIIELLILAKRFGKHEPGSKQVEIRLVEKDLAAETGLTRETISREMKVLKSKNILTFSENMLVVHDIDRLEAELESS